MKRILFTFFISFIFVAFNPLIAAEVTDGYVVKRGERPPVNLNSLTTSDYDAGKIYLKFKAEYTGLIASGFSLDENNQVKTGLSELDALNQQYQASNYRQLIQTVYNSGQKSHQYQERHKAWGFHLWFEVELAEDANILEAVEAYQSNPAIELAEPIYKTVLYDLPDGSNETESLPQTKFNKSGSERYTPDDPLLGAQWHYNNTGSNGGTAGRDISLFDAWDIEKGHSDVIVAIVDGGIQTDHEDLAGNMWSGVGYNFVDDNSTIVPHSHGTHVAGTVAAETNNTTGVAGVAGGSGSNDGVRLMSCQVFKAVDGGNQSGGFAEAMIYAADNDAAISQNSWGTTPAGAYSTLILDAIDYFNTNGGGSVLNGGITIFAAGNDDDDANYYPGYYSGVLVVSATNNNDERSYYSNYGDYIDISAPGGELYVGFFDGGVYSTDITNSYSFKQGTSMACPHVSGVAALIVSYAHRNGVTLKNDDVFQILKETADDHYAQNPGFTGKLGTGRLNANAALLATNNYFSPTALTPDHYFDFDGTMQGWYSVATTGNKNFVWTNQGGYYGGQISSASASNGYVMYDNLNVDTTGPNPAAALLYSPVFDLQGATNLYFSFEHKARHLGQEWNPAVPNMSLKLEASNDGFATNVQELWSYDFPDTQHLIVEGNQSVDISALAGSSNIQFRFNYAGGAGYWWLIDDVSITSLSTPAFSLAEGFYISDQTVFISNFNDYDPGTNIYYTLDGSTPTSSSALYDNTNGILLENISGSVTIYAIAINGANESGIGSATYYFPVHVANIATLRTMAQDGTTYKLIGEAVLTFQTTYRNAKYIQDATGAIVIDDNSGIITTSYDIYDGITGIIGTLGVFNNLLQFSPIADPGEATSSGNSVTPEEVTLADLNTAHQAKLVKVTNTSITGTGDFAASTNYQITDPSKATGVLRTAYSDLDYIGNPIPEVSHDITGVVLQYGDNSQLVPRSYDDFAFPRPLTFYVDMTNAPAFTTLEVRGSYNGWSGNEMTLVSDNIYTFTTAAIDVGEVVEFKFRIADDNTWEGGANRTYTVIAGTNEYHAVWNVMVPAEITYANLQWPASGEIDNGDDYNVYAWVYANGLTGEQGDVPNLQAWVGYSSTDSDPATWTNWVSASFNTNVGNNEEYMANIGASISEPGVYYYASRFKLGLDEFVYGGYSGSGGGFWDGINNVSGVLTINATVPTSHVTDFAATANSSTSITVSWTDSDASSYLVKASTVGYGDITSPTDGVAEADDVLVKNVAAGTNSVDFTGLTASTNYYFKIFPYNGTGSTILYKTDGTVPEATATTDAAPVMPQLIISEVADPGDDYNGRFVELFNAGETEIDFSTTTIYFDRQANGGNHSSIQLSGTLRPKETYVIGNSTNINTIYGFAADLDFGSVTGNGDDGYFLFYNGDETTGQLLDAYGVIDEDGSGKEWEYLDAKAVRNSNITSPNATWTASEWTITAADVADMTPGEHNGYVYFNGTTDWNTAANWSNNKVPTSTNNVIIPAAKSNVEIASDASADCYNLTLNGSLTIKSDATGTGSLLVHGTIDGSGSTTIERYVTGGQNAGSGTSPYKYHLISIPLADDIQAGDVFTGTYLWHFLPNQSGENAWSGITSLTENLDNQKGFLSYVEDENDTFTFTGTMNNGSFSVAAENIDAGNVKLIPNPYPSAIDWEAVDLTGTGLNPTIWLFNSNTGNYESYNAGAGAGQRYIPVGQAVFAEAASANPTLTFTNAHRTHNQGNGFYKSGEETLADMLKVAVSANNSADATFIRFREQADDTYNGYDDARKLKGFSGAPQLYTKSTDNHSLSINTMACSQETMIVPLAFELEVSGEAILNFEYLETFEPSVQIFLEDLLTEQMLDLRENSSYTFNHESTNDPDRFKLHFMGVTSVDEQLAMADHFRVWTNENQLYVLPTDELTEGSLQIELFDLSGRLIQSVNQQIQKPLILSLPAYEGIVLVRIQNEKLVQTQKVFIR